MNIRLGRMPWAMGWLFIGSLVAAAPPSASDVARWIRQLGEESFGAREAAFANLASAGDAAIEPLIECICAGAPEAAWRATAVLQHSAMMSDDRQYGNIIASLKRKNENANSKLTPLICELDTKRVDHRRRAALDKIRALGGRFAGDPAAVVITTVAQPTKVSSPAPPPDLPLDNNTATNNQPQVLIADAYVSPLVAKDVLGGSPSDSLTIDQNWRGGDKGLVSLCDLPGLAAISIRHAPLTDAALETIAQMPAIQSLEIDDTPFSAAALTKFRSRQPRARITSRDSTTFGVSASP